MFQAPWADDEQSTIAKATMIRKMNALRPQSAVNTLTPVLPRAREAVYSASSHAPAANQDDSSSTEYLALPPLPEDSELLAFWKLRQEQFPTLVQLLPLYLTIQASSAPVERLFSVAGKVFHPDRCRLTDQKFERIMFVGSNQK